MNMTESMYDQELPAAGAAPPAGGESAQATEGIQDAQAGTDGNSAKIEPANLGLVMDLELNVTLRFGQRQLTLREVLDLSGGSVVELDRQVEEPIELLLDGKVIARGEAVVIDGNYGLRVSEVPQPLSPPNAATLRRMTS
jgi:flagellar motor switch protein FliN